MNIDEENRNGDFKRRKALEVCKQRGADILRQMLESPNCKVSGGFGHGWEMVINQHDLVEEIFKLTRMG